MGIKESLGESLDWFLRIVLSLSPYTESIE